MMKRNVFIGIVLPFFFVLGCAGLSKADSYLVRTLDDQAKAKALTDQGIEKYQLWLVQKQDYSKIAEIREYFITALSFDPDNVVAAQYRTIVDNFKSTRLRQATRDATTLFAKAKRREDEDLQMCLAVQTAMRLDPSNATVIKLQKDTSTVRDRLVASYQTRIKADMDKIAKGGAPETLEASYIDAYQNATRQVLIDPQNSSVANQKNSLAAELGKIFTRHFDSVGKLITAWKFDAAVAEITTMAGINRTLGGPYDAKIRSSQYSLNFQWARSHYSKKEYPLAASKLNAALSIQKSDEALALQKKIAEITSQAAAEASFESSIADVDALLAQGQLVAANEKINVLLDSASEQGKQDQLEDRRSKVTSKLKDLYASAVDAYRKENFKDAIEKFQVIVQINVDYEQAADYLEKAKAKQKLIDAY
jgi:hypothetical protein